MLARPRLAGSVLRRRRPDEVSRTSSLPDGPMRYADVGAALEAVDGVVGRLRVDPRRLEGPIVVKGVHTADDARRAVDAGADGDRRVESRRPPARRRGGDAPRAARSGRRGRRIAPRCCSTAASAAAATSSRRCAWARAPCWSAAPTPTGWAPPAAPASTRAIEILRADLVRTLKLLGCASTAALDRTYIETPGQRRGDF